MPTRSHVSRASYLLPLRALLLGIIFISSTGLQARSYFQRAKYAFSLGELENAYRLFEKAKKRRPKSGNPLFYMGYIREQQHKKDQAVGLYEAALELRLEENLKEKAFWKVVLYYKETRNWERLLLYADEFLKFRGHHRSVRKLRDLAKSNYDPNKPTNIALLKKAREHRQAGQHEQAATLINKVLALSPAHLAARWELALLQMEEKKFHLAATHLKILTREAPKNWKYHYKAGVCHYRLGQSEKALKHLTEARKYYSENDDSFIFYVNYMLGHIHLEQGKARSALSYLRKAARLRELGSLDTALARAYWNLQEYKRAVQHARRAIQKETKQKHPESYLILAVHAYQKDKSKKAYELAAAMASALALKGSSAKPKNNAYYTPGFLLLAQSAIAGKNWQEAVKLLKKVDKNALKKISTAKKPTPLQALAKNFDRDLATALLYSNQPKEALVYYQRLGSKPDVLFARARCYAILLKPDEARSHLERASQAKPALWEQALTDEAFQNLMKRDPEFQEFMQK